MCKPFRSAIILGVAITALMPPALAQTVINMPAPPKKTEPAVVPSASAVDSPARASAAAPISPAPTAATNGRAVAVAPSAEPLGEIALARYSRARSGTYDTYYSDGMYGAGIRTYSYPRYFPQFIWGPWWGWGGFGFHSHSFCK